MTSKILKLEEYLYLLFIFLISNQLGKHFWFSFSYIQGLRIDYLSPTFYLTDLIILILLFIQLFKINFKKIKLTTKRNLFIGVWLFILLSGIVLSISPLLGMYKIIKVFEFLLFGFYLVQKFSKKNLFKKTILTISVSLIFQSILVIAQFLKQSSIGGLLYYFGERTFTGQTPGIANASINGELILRPYGTFSHPNLLAGFLVIMMTLIMAQLLIIKNRSIKYLYVLSIILGTIALVLSMSRISVFIFIITTLTLFIKNKKKYFAIFVFTLITIAFFFRGRFFNFNLNEEAITQRSNLIIASWNMFYKNFFLGVGLNNFLSNITRFGSNKDLILQPVHNIYALVLAETGFLGISFLIAFIKKTIDRIIKDKSVYKELKFLIFIIIIFLGMFDHYLLTLQQGQILLVLSLGFIFAKQE